MGKGENAGNQHFLIFPQCFLSQTEIIISARLNFFVCNCFHFGKGQNFVVWERVNPFPNKPWFLHVCSTSLLKTLCENEKLLITSKFSFSHSFSSHLKNSLPFSSNFKLSSANSINLEESKICRLVTG